MPEMYLFSCLVALGGDTRNQIPPASRGWGDGIVSGPEVELLAALHGNGSILDLRPVAKTETSARKEKERLSRIYGGAEVERVFPGMNPAFNFTPSMAELQDAVHGPQPEGDDDEPTAMAPVGAAIPLAPEEAELLAEPAPKPKRAKRSGPMAEKAARTGIQLGDGTSPAIE